VVGDVDALERRKAAAQDVLLGEELNFSGAVAQANEAGLAETAAQNHAPEHQERLLIAERFDLLGVVAQLFCVDQRGGELEAQSWTVLLLSSFTSLANGF